VPQSVQPRSDPASRGHHCSDCRALGRIRALRHVSVRTGAYGDLMPEWIVLLLVAIGAWFALSIGGGLVVGWLLSVAERHRRQPPRRTA
jgi:hypothetical protein